MSDPHDLQRFVDAQAPVFETVMDELRHGRKRTHWMWFIFPQIAGLGFSAMSQRYTIRSREEAKAYLAHPLLGARLRDCVEALLALRGRSAHDVLGSPDDMKLRSSLTLFATASDGDALFSKALARFFDEPDPETLRLLG